MSTAGLFTNMSPLGRGTYGVVFKATERATGKVVAFKRMTPTHDDDGVPAAAIREVCLLKELRHDNIVELFDVLFGPKKITMIFELCDYDLKKYTDSKPHKCLEVDEIRPTLKQIFNGLKYLHGRSIVHRDIKPQNVFLNIRPVKYPLSDGTATHSKTNRYAGGEDSTNNNNNNEFVVSVDSSDNRRNNPLGANDGDGAPPMQLIIKLGDFGLARVENIPVKKYSHEAVTLWYRSPDIIMGSSLYGFPVDVWSVGVTFFEMVTGNTLFSGMTEEEQLIFMFRLLGSPTKESWPSLPSYPNHKDRLVSTRRLVQDARNGTADTQGILFRRYNSALARPGVQLPPPMVNTYQLPEELWYPQPLFDLYMDSTKFRARCGDEGVDLLRQCLRYEPSQRITAADALNHPFLRKTTLPTSGYLDVLMTTLQQTLNPDAQQQQS
ncbi:cyclin-dependent kinase 3 [Angomonas deanei]|uniref:cyclin-dependent kinase n=1 Tax=Angomonas deanei TaxID=59799 RepID=A0A7G2CKP1_9TRYP|nr:cyclin-dependent kinase 3 [Angomonas deanei]CAD2219484.1 Protein kinase domain/Protein tyrosine kinase, putative [Angomonas deanei]|eukprot:EPY32501.1 cyclin-dependent kinase 3 [Angomonas deanei]